MIIFKNIQRVFTFLELEQPTSTLRIEVLKNGQAKVVFCHLFVSAPILKVIFLTEVQIS